MSTPKIARPDENVLLPIERRRGVLFVLAAAITWSTGGLGVKLVDGHPATIAGFRSLFAAMVLLGGFVRAASRHGIDAKHAARSLVRRWTILGASVGYATMVVCFVFATKLTTAANAILIQYAAPIYVALFSWPVLRERMRWWDWLAVTGCIAGLVLFFRDQVSASGRLGDLVAVVSGLGFASLPLLLRLEQRRLEGGAAEQMRLVALASLFACFLGNVVAVGVCLPWMVSDPPRGGVAWTVLVGLGTIQIGLAYVFYSAGVRRLRAVESTLVCTLEPILSPVWVLLGTGERPTPSAILGGALIVMAVTAQGVLSGIGTAATRRENA
jgi:drug/metabolite transporter, DME family